MKKTIAIIALMFCCGISSVWANETTQKETSNAFSKPVKVFIEVKYSICCRTASTTVNVTTSSGDNVQITVEATACSGSGCVTAQITAEGKLVKATAQL